jgi:DNA polymerase-4
VAGCWRRPRGRWRTLARPKATPSRHEASQLDPQAPQRKIIHLDCDCFFAAVEIRDDPSLAELPVAVGGDADRRGVLTTANYIARTYGVRSAMPSAHARRLCPGLLIIPPNFEKYRAVSRQIRAIFYDYTDLVEPLSLDEAYLDVTESTACRGSATLIARDIRQRVRREIGITISAGVAPNKFVAKVASDWNKPDGECVVLPEEVDAFVAALPVKRIYGVGKATAERLQRMGVESCADLRQHTVFDLTERFGRFGQRLFELSRGIDSRAVQPSQRRKSLSVERTYAEDLRGLEACRRQLPELLLTLRSRLRRVDEGYLVTKLHLKIKFADFQLTSAECSGRELQEGAFASLLEEALGRSDQTVRLLGVGVRFVDLREQANPAQYELFEREQALT